MTRKIFFNLFYLTIAGLVILIPFAEFTNIENKIDNSAVSIANKVIIALVLIWLLLSLGIFKKEDWKKMYSWIPMIIFLLVGVVFSLNLKGSLIVSSGFVFKGFIFGVTLHLLGKNLDIRSILTALTCIFFINSIVGIIEGLMEYNPIYHVLYMASGRYYEYAHYVRGGIVGTIGHPVPFSILNAVFVPIALSLHLQKVVKFVITTSLLVSVILAESRSGLIILIFVTVIWMGFALLRSKNERSLKILFFIGTLNGLLLLGVGVRSVVKGHYLYSIKEDTHRMSALKMTRDIMRDHPWTGLGWGVLPQQFEKYYYKEQMDRNTPTVDNQYLRIITETGVWGAILYLVFMAYVILHMFQKLRQLKWDEKYGSLCAATVGLMASLLTFDGFYWFQFQFIFWSLVGLNLAYGNESQ